MDQTSSRVVIPNAYLRHFVAGIGNAPELLEGTTQSLESLRRPGGTFTFSEYKQFVRNARFTNGSDIGLRLGQLRAVSYLHGAVGSAVLNSASVGDGIRLAARFAGLRVPAFETSLYESDTEIGIELTYLCDFEDVIAPISEIALLCFYSMISTLCCESLSPSSVQLTYARPEHIQAYERVFGTKDVVFEGDATRIVYSKDDASLRSSLDPDPLIRNLSIERCEQLIKAQRIEAQIVRRVTIFLRDNPGQLWSVGEVARFLGMSSRTLQRQLSDAGYSYHDLLNEHLMQTTRVMLIRSDCTIEHVALSLGYSDVGTFRRACRRWFGMSPMDLKHSIQENMVTPLVH